MSFAATVFIQSRQQLFQSFTESLNFVRRFLLHFFQVKLHLDQLWPPNTPIIRASQHLDFYNLHKKMLMIIKTVNVYLRAPELEDSKKLIIRKNRSIMQFPFIQLRYFCM